MHICNSYNHSDYMCSINIIILILNKYFKCNNGLCPQRQSLWHSGTWHYFLCVLSAPDKFLHRPFAEQAKRLSGPSISMKEEREIGKESHSLIHLWKLNRFQNMYYRFQSVFICHKVVSFLLISQRDKHQCERKT